MLTINNNDKDLLIDEFAEFCLRYKCHIDPDNRPIAISLLDKVLSTLKWDKEEIAKLNMNLKDSKSINDEIMRDKIDAEDRLLKLRDEIEDLLNMPFEGKSNNEAHERLGQDMIVNYIVKEIIPKYIRKN